MSDVRKLNLIFATADPEVNFTVTLADPVENPDTETIMQTMEQIAMKGVLQDSEGHAAIGAFGAKVVTTGTEILF